MRQCIVKSKIKFEYFVMLDFQSIVSPTKSDMLEILNSVNIINWKDSPFFTLTDPLLTKNKEINLLFYILLLLLLLLLLVLLLLFLSLRLTFT